MTEPTAPGKRILASAERYNVEVSASSWQTWPRAAKDCKR
jgi:hypothetical protein